MLDRVYRYAGIAAVVAAIVIVIFAVHSSPSYQQCKTDQTQSAGEQKQEKIAPHLVSAMIIWRCTGNFIDKNDPVIAAIATVVIAIFTIILVLVTNRQARLTKEAFIIDKRAFVFATGVIGMFEPDIAAGHFNWRLSVNWLNSGETATAGLEFYIDCLLSNAPMTPGFDLAYINPGTAPGAGMLGPKMSGPAGQVPRPGTPAITPQDILDIQNGTKFLYLWGSARYSDILPEQVRHITRFYWQIFVTGNPYTFNPLIDAQSVRFTNLYLARGNCADDECIRQNLP